VAGVTGPPWPVRRVGDRILCGRPTPVSGGCRGEIATISDGRAVLRWGMIEDPPASHVWRLSNRAKDQAARGQKISGHAVRAMTAGRAGTVQPHVPAMPWRRKCPTCNVLAEVTAAVLESP
jgi:hypothetical protein